jgi:hypothetical protein
MNIIIKNGENAAKKMQEIESIIMRCKTQTTYEAIDIKIEYRNMLAKVLSDSAKAELRTGPCMYDVVQASKVVTHATLGNADKVLGVYKIEKYIDAFQQLEGLMAKLSKADIESRQLIVQFEPIHCFQTIQLLVRRKQIFVICNMRSCNFKVNYLTDVYIAYFMGVLLQWRLKELKCTTPQINVIMNVGSLHIFK